MGTSPQQVQHRQAIFADGRVVAAIQQVADNLAVLVLRGCCGCGGYRSLSPALGIFLIPIATFEAAIVGLEAIPPPNVLIQDCAIGNLHAHIGQQVTDFGNAHQTQP